MVQMTGRNQEDNQWLFLNTVSTTVKQNIQNNWDLP